MARSVRKMISPSIPLQVRAVVLHYACFLVSGGARWTRQQEGVPTPETVASKENTRRHTSLCRAYTEEAVRHLAALMRQPETPPGVRVQAVAVAELEAGMISARTKAALAAAKRRGKQLGGNRGVVPSKTARKRGAASNRRRADARATDCSSNRERTCERRNDAAGHCGLSQQAAYSERSRRRRVGGAGSACDGPPGLVAGASRSLRPRRAGLPRCHAVQGNPSQSGM